MAFFTKLFGKKQNKKNNNEPTGAQVAGGGRGLFRSRSTSMLTRIDAEFYNAAESRWEECVVQLGRSTFNYGAKHEVSQCAKMLVRLRV